jgi:peptidoglycan/xylan/chitin deacetylase (PgdA/CDA1 family)
MVISPARFEAQLDWLARNGWRVVRLDDVAAFLEGRQALPERSVVITIDDGYESVHRHAWPLLRKYGFPATLFVYTDFVGAGGDALSWAQLREMTASGLIDVQSHSKTHRNLVDRLNGETDEQYRRALDVEMRVPRQQLEARLPAHEVTYIAYPFGDADEAVVDAAGRHGFRLGLTVVPGGNPFFAQPLLLRRTMIFGDLDLEGFKARLQTRRSLPAS